MHDTYKPTTPPSKPHAGATSTITTWRSPLGTFPIRRRQWSRDLKRSAAFARTNTSITRAVPCDTTPACAAQYSKYAASSKSARDVGVRMLGKRLHLDTAQCRLKLGNTPPTQAQHAVTVRAARDHRRGSAQQSLTLQPSEHTEHHARRLTPRCGAAHSHWWDVTRAGRTVEPTTPALRVQLPDRSARGAAMAENISPSTAEHASITSARRA